MQQTTNNQTKTNKLTTKNHWKRSKQVIILIKVIFIAAEKSINTE